MEWGPATLGFYGVGAAAVAASVAKLRKRLELSQSKHASLAGHARIAHRLARFVPFYQYDMERFFCSDGAPASSGFRNFIGHALRRRFDALPRRRRRCPICNSPPRIACRSNIAASCEHICLPRALCNARAA